MLLVRLRWIGFEAEHFALLRPVEREALLEAVERQPWRNFTSRHGLHDIGGEEREFLLGGQCSVA